MVRIHCGDEERPESIVVGGLLHNQQFLCYILSTARGTRQIDELEVDKKKICILRARIYL